MLISFENLVRKLKDHYDTGRKKTLANFEFRKLKQKHNESLEVFVASRGMRHSVISPATIPLAPFSRRSRGTRFFLEVVAKRSGRMVSKIGGI